MPFFFPERLADFFQLIRPVIGFFPYILADKNRRLGLGGQDNAIAGTRVNLNDLRVDLVMGLEDDPGKIGIAPQRIDDDTLHLDIKSVEDVTDQFVSERSFVMLTAHRHGDGTTDAGFDMDDKTLFVIADEDGQRVLIRGKYSKNLHAHHIRVHNL